MLVPPDSSPAAEPLLTIMIPVYNGAKYLGHLLTLFADAYAETPAHFERVEIIVANNLSEDRTQEIAESFVACLPILRPIAMSAHMQTAEENIFRSFPYCRGIYTWALGVDDIPNFAVFGRMIALLAAGQADFYLFNFASVSQKMELTRTSLFHMRCEQYDINLVDLTQRFGFWGAIAGISGQIMRTAAVRDYDFKALIDATGKVYAHVTAYLECFKSGRTSVINIPLVFYKWTAADAQSHAHWRNGAKTLGVFDEYFWTRGYIRQLEYLERKDIISSDYLRYMLEANEANLFRPIFVVADKFANQLRIMSETDEQRNRLTEAEFDGIYRYLLRKEPFLRDYLWKLRDIYGMLREGRRVGNTEWQELKRFEQVFSDYLIASLFQAEAGDYEIYRVARSYYGVHRCYRHVLLERLRYLDGEEFAPEVFKGDSLEEVTGKITLYEQRSVELRRIRRERSFKPAPPQASGNGSIMVKDAGTPRGELDQLKKTLQIIEQSLSWKITRPLRWGMAKLRGFRA
jgi:glycosyltransferase involved in cell wall biosynthesis